jgi:hypothetical protein
VTQPVPSTSSRRKAWRWIAILIVAWIVIVTVSFILVRASGERRREEALERLRASGAAVLPEELPTRPVRGGTAPTAWLARGVAEIGDDPYAQFEYMARPMPFAPGSRVVVTPAALFAHARASGPRICDTSTLSSDGCKAWLAELSSDQEQFRAAISAALFDPAEMARRRECWIEVLVRTWKLDQGVDPGLDACSVAQLELLRVLEDSELSGQPRPFLATVQMPSLAHLQSLAGRLVAAGQVAALRGDAEASVRAFEAALCAASLPAELPWVEAYDLWARATCDALDGFVVGLSALPRDADLSRLRAMLDELRPRDRWLAALEGERALGNRVYVEIGNGGATSDAGEPLMAGLVYSAWGGHDQAAFLAHWERLLEAARRTPAESRAAGGAPEIPGAMPISGAWFAAISADPAQWAEVQARIELCELAMVARTDGVDAARAACAGAVDPFDDAPIRERVEKDGSLTLWSVGANGLDDRGVLPKPVPYGWTAPPDIVVRVLPP